MNGPPDLYNTIERFSPMAKARRKSITPKSRRGKIRERKRAKSGPERPLIERLKDYPLKPLRLDLSPEELAEALRRQEAPEARSKVVQEGRRLIDRANAFRDGLIPTPKPVRVTVRQEEPAGNQTATAAWLSVAAKTMKDAGEISAEITKSGFARELEEKMRRAARVDHSIRPVGWRHIKNMLRVWGLWPISAIR